jgi:hypothetical protein
MSCEIVDGKSEVRTTSKGGYTKEQAEKEPYYDKTTRRDRLLDLWTQRY